MRPWPSILLLLCALLGLGLVNSRADRTASANRSFEQGHYDDALQGYREVLVEEPDSRELRFNIGAAEYRKGEYEKAAEEFSRVLASPDADLARRAGYNAGNCKYRLGRKKETTDIPSAKKLYKEALAHYERVLGEDPGDDDAKFNHEFVEMRLKELKELEEQQKQEEQENDQQQEERGDDGGEQEDGQDQQEPTGDEDDSGEDGEDDSPGKPETGDEDDPSDDEDGEQLPREADTRQMSPEEARSLIESLEGEEVKQLTPARLPGRGREAYKDW